MAPLELWARRPIEEANLFSPPFLCALTYEFVKNFSSDHKEYASLFLVTLGLATSLHRASRDRLPYSTVTPLYAWVQEHEELLVGFSQRASNLAPYIKEGILFGLATDTLACDSMANLQLGAKRAAFPKSFLEETTLETKAIIERTRFMGRWLSKSGSLTSIAAALGVRP